MKAQLKKEYTNGEITVVWKPKICIHAGECVKTLPQVYDPKKRPWINIQNASTDELKAQIKKCPSGALSFYMNEDENPEIETLETVVEVLENGPLIIYGTLKVTNKDGKTETKDNTTAFCRCGHSTNKPYCDGSHKREGFVG